jgi:hypothetical protein
VQRNIVAVLVTIDTLNDVNFTNRILVEVIRPASIVREIVVSPRPKRNSLGRPDTTGNPRHVLNISDQDARAVRLLRLKTNTSASMLESSRCEERCFVCRVYSKVNFAIVGVNNTRAHCLVPAQIVDGATSGIALVAGVNTIKVGTLHGGVSNVTYRTIFQKAQLTSLKLNESRKLLESYVFLSVKAAWP